ncbi:VOC family protein [Kibdelosporangium aridum]|uniref:4a-hydroxytetrahydrobiopterin dehydratase n=1 Tax=Kibdelosporangium aridum TaxID=2030 RepID=A0A1W2FSM5_KIBAR|nr:VOC family protein [Kibdelosporangium aridum]SMD24628.1 4a-hydroxytetrahydrobiopterin dehydratase [Kibdelosporangium aridum]
MRAREFHESQGVEDWRVLVGDEACAHFMTGSFAAGAHFAQSICPMLEGKQADVDIRPDGVTVRLTEPDAELARRISAVARKSGMASVPVAPQRVQISIDALGIPEVMPFWRAVLGYTEWGDEDLVDPRRSGPPVWFQQSDIRRSRMHVDVYVPHDQGEARVAAAIAAGGTLVTDEFAPSWWVLADPEGNEACVGTWLDRE